MAWIIGENGYPTNTDFIEITENYIEKPYPLALWIIGENGYPTNGPFLDTELLGAFANATKLQEVSIPKTVKKIGKYAFRNTQLRSVTIASDCTYYDTSFPPNCEIKFHGGGGEYSQLYDSEGYAIIDADGARIFVRE